MTNSAHAGAVLTIDLDAVAANWRLLRERAALSGAACAAVVKADAYGLGVARVAPTLWDAGCLTFFVATLDEGLELRALLPEAEIFLFNGAPPGCEPELAHHRLCPVLNSLRDVDAWSAAGGGPAALHVDTGMCRLGLPDSEALTLARAPGRLKGVRVTLLLSHLACAEEPDHPLNHAQLAAFRDWAGLLRLTGIRESLANSSGVFLGQGFHFHLVRPGAALYGVNPTPGRPNPMAPVVRLQARILQVRDVDTPQTVGYGATHRVQGRGRLATVPVGYADGYPRSLGNAGGGYFGDVRAPVVGRVSMDLITLDVSHLPEDQVRPGTMVDIIGPHNAVDRVAREAGTIGYEILTSLGTRHHRVYRGGGGRR